MSQPEPDLTDPTPGMHIWGWMSPDELRWLGEQAAQMESVVEIGVLHGRSSFALLTACPGPVYCIDPFDDGQGNNSFPSFMESCGHFSNLYPIRGRSPDVLKTFFTEPRIDMVWIDGDHSYVAVMADINGWLPCAEKLICGHDYYTGPDANYPGVARAVHDVFGVVTNPPGTGIWAVWL